jgi:hypothetical protein
VLLEMLISEVEKSVYLFSSVRPGEPSALPFIWSSEGSRAPKTLRRCLRGEGSMGAVEVVVAACSGNGRPSPGCRGDVDDGTMNDPGSCVERVIPCSRHAGVIPLLTGGGRGRVRT